MKILCNHCKHFFEVDPEKAGRVQYSKTKSIFRVELILKSPCPSCGTSLKVIANEKNQHIGYPIEASQSKKIAAEKTTPPQKPYELSANSETVFNPLPKKPALVQNPVISKPISKPVAKPVVEKKIEPKKVVVSNDQRNIETRLATPPKKKAATEITNQKTEITLEDRVKEKLKLRLDSHHRISVQSFKKPEAKAQKKIFIPNVSKIAQHASNPKVYLSILTLSTAFLIFGIMKSVFNNPQPTVASQEAPTLEEGLEEFEPMHHDDSVGGPSFPSELDRKTGLEDETIKKITSNLQILHLPPLRQVTSTYGIRLDPFTKKLAFHAGVDFKANMGTKIEAAMDGIVKSAGKKSMYGNAVVIKHDNGYETLYGHLSKMLVKKGQKIKQKDIIGLAGSSGRSTGPHLHFELIKNGKKIDPLSTDLLLAKKK